MQHLISFIDHGWEGGLATRNVVSPKKNTSFSRKTGGIFGESICHSQHIPLKGVENGPRMSRLSFEQNTNLQLCMFRTD
jgi:hypothetical protein